MTVFIAPQDEQSLQRMLGLGSGPIPKGVQDEYAIRKRMFDSDGSGGPLGTVGLIDLVRSLGLGPPAVSSPAGAIDWRAFPQDGTVRVECGPFFGQWEEGVFLGFVEHGTLAIKTYFDGVVHECRRDQVRLSADQSPRVPPSDTLSPPVDSAKVEQAKVEAVTALAKAADEEPASKPHDPPEIVASEGERPVFQPDPSFDWSGMKEGDELWVQHADDIADAQFVRLGLPGEVVVLMEDGTELTVPAASATPAGASVA